jgi:hypothetical protein
LAKLHADSLARVEATRVADSIQIAELDAQEYYDTLGSVYVDHKGTLEIYDKKWKTVYRSAVSGQDISKPQMLDEAAKQARNIFGYDALLLEDEKNGDVYVIRRFGSSSLSKADVGGIDMKGLEVKTDAASSGLFAFAALPCAPAELKGFEARVVSIKKDVSLCAYLK